jgi:hypothetical protein
MIPSRTTSIRNHRFLIMLFLFYSAIAMSWSDDVMLSDFPRGKWLDPEWNAYWAFGETSMRLLDMQDKVIWDFAGIVSDMKVEIRENGDRRLTFACQKAGRSYEFVRTAKGAMLMSIRRFGTDAAYRVEMPTISEQQLRVYKQAVISNREEEATALVSGLMSEQSDSSSSKTVSQQETVKTDAGFQDVIDQAASSDLDRIESTLKSFETAGKLDEAIRFLEGVASSPTAPPSVYLALSVAYGRKGLKTQQYAALVAAERAPVPPGMNFNVAVLYGRKQLLAGQTDAADFMVGHLDVSSGAPGAALELDGVAKGTVPVSLEKVPAGHHRLTVRADGYEEWNAELDLDVGERRSFEPIMAVLNEPIKGPVPIPSRTIVLDGAVDDWTGIEPILTGPSKKRLSMPGTDLRAVYLAADKTYWYVRMDFGNGLLSAEGTRKKEQILELTADFLDLQQQYLQLKLVAVKGSITPTITALVKKNSMSVIVSETKYDDNFKTSGGVVEMRFPIKEISRYLKKTDVSEAYATVNDGTAIPAVTTRPVNLIVR